MRTFKLHWLIACALVLVMGATQPPGVYLEETEHWVTDSTRYQAFRVNLINTGDSAVYIDRVHPSCGCVLASVQRNRATKEKPGEIYVAVTTAEMDTLQPITVDVFTRNTPDAPLRLYIRKKTTDSR